jgi:glycosyltransferase involved in cell wall biosynthesis
MIFCDAQAARRAELHRLAKKLGILNRLSLIDELEGRRDLVVEGDLLIQPEAGGEARSVTLEAMAHGMVVLAAADPAVTALRDGVTCRLISSPTASAWEAAVGTALSDRAGSQALARSATAYVREHHRASRHIRAILDAYDAIGAARVMSFPSGRP